MKKAVFWVPAFLMLLLPMNSHAFGFHWPGKGRHQAEKKVKRLVGDAMRAYGSADYTKVIDLTSQAIKADAKFAKAYILRAKAKKDMGDIDNAFKDLNRAVELDPKSGEAFFIRAQANDIMGNMDKAKKDYTKSCALGFRLACE